MPEKGERLQKNSNEEGSELAHASEEQSLLGMGGGDEASSPLRAEAEKIAGTP